MVEVYERGQVVIPKYIRELFKLVPGTQVSFSVEDRRIILETENEALNEFRALTSQADLTDEQTNALIAKAREKQAKEWNHVH